MILPAGLREILYNFTVRKVMIYGLGGDALQKAEMAFDVLKIDTIVIGDDVLEETLASVMEKDGGFSERHTEFDLPYMVAQDMTAEEFAKCFFILERFGLKYDGLKILRTNFNENWTIRHLFQATRASYDVLKDAVILKELIGNCESLYGSAGDAASKAEMKKRTENAKKLLASGKYTNESVKQAIAELTESLHSYRKLYN
jgi:hypothetical protein